MKRSRARRTAPDRQEAAAQPSSGLKGRVIRWWQQLPPPEGDLEEPRWATRRALRAGFFVALPFLLAILMSGFARWHRIHDASSLVEQVAFELVETRTTQPDLTEAQVIERVITARYGNDSPAEQKRYDRLARSVGYHLKELLEAGGQASPVTPRERFVSKLPLFREQVNRILRENSLWMLLAQSFFLIMFAGFLLSSFLEARVTVLQSSWRARQKTFRTFGEKVFYRRARYYLAEEGRPYFMTTMAFAILIAQGSTYVLAPQGLMASIVGEYMMQVAPPGASSMPHWFLSFDETPGIVAGFSGFLLYATVNFLRQYSTGNLTRMFLLSLVNRGLAVLLISLTLAAVLKEDVRAMLFLVGIFPQTGLDALARITQSTVESVMADDGKGFVGILELDFAKQTLLQNVGIYTLHDLASIEMHAVMEQVGIDPEVLLRAVDRAALMSHLGAEATARLAQKMPVATASELVLYARYGEAIYRAARKLRAGGAVAGELPSLHLDQLEPLPEEEQQARQKNLVEVLEARDVRQLIAELENNVNVRYIILQKLTYQDDMSLLAGRESVPQADAA